MSIWIEIHCCNSENPSAQAESPYSSIDKKCWANSGNMVSGGSKSTQKSVIETFQYLENHAKKLGWKKTKFGWICPYCILQPNTMSELAAD